MKAVKDIVNALKGFAMGAANVVPGVSGGTIALISGIYEELVDALNAIMSPETWRTLVKEGFGAFWKKIHGRFLLFLLIGVAASIFSLAKIVEEALERNPIHVWAFFFGLIIASAFFMLRDIKGWKAKDIAITAAGAVLGLAVCTLSPTTTPDSMWFIFICGAIAICTMILPGISGSFILVIFGKYDYIMEAVSEMNIPVLLVFALGCIIGILAFAKFLHWLLGRWERQTMLVLIGFVIGSLIKVWPWYDMNSCARAQMIRTNLLPAQLLEGDSADFALDIFKEMGLEMDLQIPGAVLWCLAGIIVIIIIELLGRKTAK